MKFRLAIISSHPIQYQTPLFKRMAAHPDIDLTVYFCRDFGEGKKQYDPGFNMEIKWDIPLMEGYKYKFLPNLSLKPSSGFFGLINPTIIKELFKNRYDAVCVHGYASLTYWFAFGGALLSRTPIILRGESHLLKHRSGWKKTLKEKVLSKLFKHISSFLTIGTLNAEYYGHYGVPPKKMTMAPYAVNNDFFSDKYRILKDQRQCIRKKMRIDSEKQVILFASKMMPRKRAIDLLKAYQRIHNRVNAELVLVGDGSEKTSLENYVKNSNLKGVHFAGFKNQTELPDYFASADVFVLPSDDEPWGLIINEAMNFGLPVITTDKVGAAPDLVRHGENGFIYPACSIEKLAGYLQRLLNAPELRREMGRNSSEIISGWSYQENIDGIITSLTNISAASDKQTNSQEGCKV